MPSVILLMGFLAQSYGQRGVLKAGVLLLREYSRHIPWDVIRDACMASPAACPGDSVPTGKPASVGTPVPFSVK